MWREQPGTSPLWPYALAMRCAAVLLRPRYGKRYQTTMTLRNFVLRSGMLLPDTTPRRSRDSDPASEPSLSAYTHPMPCPTVGVDFGGEWSAYAAAADGALRLERHHS
eukprot:3159796-Rhodomonas_salina.1